MLGGGHFEETKLQTFCSHSEEASDAGQSASHFATVKGQWPCSLSGVPLAAPCPIVKLSSFFVTVDFWLCWVFIAAWAFL